MGNHPLVKYVAVPAEPLVEEEVHPAYDPDTQLQILWNEISNHMEILAS